MLHVSLNFATLLLFARKVKECAIKVGPYDGSTNIAVRTVYFLL